MPIYDGYRGLREYFVGLKVITGIPRYISPLYLLIPRYVTKGFRVKSSTYKFMGLGTYFTPWNKNKINTYRGTGEIKVIKIEDYMHTKVI